jgi:hypothetical protein
MVDIDAALDSVGVYFQFTGIDPWQRITLFTPTRTTLCLRTS